MKTKQQLLQQLEEAIAWVKDLAVLPDDLWLTPTAEGKWSVGEIVSHLMFWDRIIVEQRLPYIKPGVQLESLNDQTVNDRASAYARSEASRQTVIDEFVHYRQAYIGDMRRRSGEELHAAFQIGQTSLTLAHYAEEMIEHDRHHKKQIDEFLLMRG